MPFLYYGRGKIQSFIVFFACFLFLLGGMSVQASEYKEPIEVFQLPEEGIVRVRTQMADYMFTEDGGELRSIFLHFVSFRDQKAELIPGTHTNPETMERSFVEGASFPGELLIEGESDRDLGYEVEIPEGTRRDQTSITFVGHRDDLEIEKTYTLYNDSNYTLGFSVSITNKSDTTRDLEAPPTVWIGSHVRANGDDEIRYLQDPTTKFIFDGEVSHGQLAVGSYQKFGGTGFIDDNLALFLRPGLPYGDKGDFGVGNVAPQATEDKLGVDLLGKTFQPGETISYQFSLYGGRRRHVLLSNVGLDAIDDIGIFSQLLVPVMGFLNWLYNLTGNYAWAIILFTILLRVILYPVMRNMYRSMAKMQKLQPKIKEIQEEYEDKQEQQKAMMALYKEEGVNPLGGCLPMFIQLPILILLWRAIMYSAEAIHLSPGFLWLNDLSSPDPYYILVVLTVVTMIVQQQMMQTPGGGGGQNKLMSYGFPLFMGIFLRDFPAGLWLYYFLTQLFMIAQQAFINWEMQDEEASASEELARQDE